MKTIIELKDISYSYNGKRDVLTDINVTIHEGEDIAIIGHNGSGKSTLGKLLIALLKPKKGELIFNDIKIDNKNENIIREKTAIVFQNPDNQFIGVTVADDIAFGLENKKIPHADMQDIINSYANKLDIKELLNREPQTLSGGQKQRVAIAGILAMNPDVIVFDEALAMLDPKGKKDISNLILDIKKENPKLTIIRITHDLDEALRSDRLFVLDKGKVIIDDTPLMVFNDIKTLDKLGLCIPPIISFNKKLVEAKVIDEPIYSLENLVAKLCK